jgi:hypothetical protein
MTPLEILLIGVLSGFFVFAEQAPREPSTIEINIQIEQPQQTPAEQPDVSVTVPAVAE